MSITSNVESFLPNLPGFRSRGPQNISKKQFFRVVEGQVIPKEEYLPVITNREMEEGSLTNIGSPASKTFNKTKMIGNFGITLTFFAYFEEFLDNGEAPRVRKCNIYYYLEDNTFKVVEKPQLNSGVSQGTLVRKAILTKADGTTYTADDLQLGSEMIIYGRTYKLVDCDDFTKRYLGLDEFEAPNVPVDSYQKHRSTLQAEFTGEWGKFHAKKNENKTYLEARLGQSVNNKGREGFIRFGNRKLVFKCVWDNTANLYGDVIEFSLHYYLSDDTIEIISIPNPNSQETLPTKLLKRSKLPKKFVNTLSLWEKADDESFFRWYDLQIGMEIAVYGRYLKIMDADSSTREFYESVDLPLEPKIPQPAPELIVHQREVPPPTGFGSDEDSLRSCFGSLIPGPAPAKKLGESKIISFFGKLLSGGVDDKDRGFVIYYHLQDQTIKIIEPVVKNSGFVGGVFLSRRMIKNEESGEIITEKVLYVGAKVKLLKHIFFIQNASEATFQWMEDKGLPRSNVYAVLDKIRPYAIQDASSGMLSEMFRGLETNEGGPGYANLEALRKVLAHYQLIGEAYYDISEHELMTILRANGNKSTYFDYEKLIREIVQPTDEYQ